MKISLGYPILLLYNCLLIDTWVPFNIPQFNKFFNKYIET